MAFNSVFTARLCHNHSVYIVNNARKMYANICIDKLKICTQNTVPFLHQKRNSKLYSLYLPKEL